MIKAHFDLHGLPLEISSDHPLLLKAFSEDLLWFRAKPRASAKGTLRLSLSALPGFANGRDYPRPFAAYREIGLKRNIPSGRTVTCYGNSAVTVIGNLRKPLIHAAVLPEMALLSDPAYHYCFTQPASPWLKRRGFFFLHAGCVSRGSVGILIAGHSRAGKSTLSLSALRGGFKFLSDEQPLLALERGRVRSYPFPRRIRIDRPAARVFPELRPVLRASSSERLIFHVETIWPGCVSAPCEPRLLIFPKFHRRGPLEISRLHSSEALARLLQDDHFVWYRNGRWARISHRHLALFEALVRQAPAFSLEYGHPALPRIPSLLHRLLDGQPP